MAHIPTYIAAKDGRREISYLHPRLEPILKSTYGIVVYQDQVLQIVRAIAGYSLGQADILRRAMGKKIKEEMAREKEHFLKGAKKNSVDAAVASKIWDHIEPFAGYAFNRAHAYCYAYIAYQTAFLKCTYPHEYMAAMLTTQGDDTEKVVAAAGECRRLGIKLLSPDVNHSGVAFTVEGGSAGVRFGLGTVKNVGEGAARHLVAERDANGPFASIDDLCERLDLRTANKRVLEALTKAGAMDCFGARERVLAALDRAMAAGQQVQRAAGIGQQSLFGGETGGTSPTVLPQVPPVPDHQRLAWEKESLGFFLSHHPFETAARRLAGKVTANTSQVTDEMKGERITVAGAVMNVRKIVTKKNETMAIAQLEDLHGGLNVVAFPRTYAANPEIWREDAILVVSGKVDVRRTETNGDDETHGVPELLIDSAEEWSPGEDDTDMEEAPELLDEAPAELAEWAAAEAVAVHEEMPSYLADPSVSPSTQEQGRVHSTGGDEPGVDEEEPGPDAEATSAPAQEALRLVAFSFHETADRASDLERLRRLYATIQRCTGDDRYVIRFMADGETKQLVGDNLRVRYSVELECEIEEILGAGAIAVER